MAVGPQFCSSGINRGKKRAEMMEGGRGLKKGAKEGGGLMHAGGIGSGKSGLFVELRNIISCCYRPVTKEVDGAWPKLSAIGNDIEHFDSISSKNLAKKADVCDETGLSTCRQRAVDGNDVECSCEAEETYLSARGNAEDVDECCLCHLSKAEEAFITSCRHRFCRSCIKEHVSKIVKEPNNPSLEVLATRSRCPKPSCSGELSWRDFKELLGEKRVRSYGRWLGSNYSNYFAPLTRPTLSQENRMHCWNVKCDQKKPSAILSVKNMKDLLIPEVGYIEEGSRVFWLCTSCDSAWCAFCGKQMPVSRIKSDPNKLHTHCTGKWRFMVYKCMVELEEACKILSRGKQDTSERKTSSRSSISTIWAAGTGYGGDNTENNKNAEHMLVAAKKKESELDTRVSAAFDYLGITLNKNKCYDEKGRRSLLPPEICVFLGVGNTLRSVLCHLATNDSMLDISERRNLYNKMITLLKEVKLCEELASILSESNKTGVSDDQLVWVANRAVASKRNKTNLNGDKVIDDENTVPKKMKNTYRQAKVMLQRFQANETTDVAAQMDINLAKDICDCYELLQGDTTMTPETSDLGDDTVPTQKRSGVKDGDSRVAIYKEKLKPLQFQEVKMVDENGQYRHHYRDQIAGKASQSTVIDKRGIHNQKRMLYMVKEVSSLSTTLPLEWESGIHLCVDENRMDVLRALIIGPNGTPYQNGIFLFDIFLPADYPQVPPSVHFLTTGGGKVRFNPNLYDTGKICLSLLGTWSGPGWTPGKSTLLQVLVSIQSLIFVRDPYYNEPGYEKKKSTDQAERENMRHREHTLSLAVLAPLRKPDSMFSNLIYEHFKHKREEVEQQCNEWLNLTTEITAKQRMASLVKDIQSELQNRYD
ncbi:uncharacterized protein [Physcomitrium patens]|uniref:UBC core domain-containing protein n=1 Tax=Physcomitrium patens TaxID=3218 RepID=A0A7I4AQ88_PHYPA|nr:probable ubiquitin-conjugating enzyme protein 17 isoform X2 [Physcomitrium patens]|eukprot:XP_024395167.1 probable ubiquitin-conjugating enzyme protein 17 isoform X2 [Physcomitrella patens]